MSESNQDKTNLTDKQKPKRWIIFVFLSVILMAKKIKPGYIFF